LVDFHIVCGECVGEVELDEDVVCIRWDGKKVLLLLASSFVSYGEGEGRWAGLTPPRSTAF
jgi:hypothetical protein